MKCSSLNLVTTWPVALSQIHAIYEEVLYSTVPLRLSSHIVWLCLCVVVFWCFLCVCVFVFFGVCAFVFLRVCVLCLGFLFVVKAVWCNCVCVSPNRFSHRGSYFKLGGEGSQILWIRCRDIGWIWLDLNSFGRQAPPKNHGRHTYVPPPKLNEFRVFFLRKSSKHPFSVASC